MKEATRSSRTRVSSSEAITNNEQRLDPDSSLVEE